MTRFVVDAAGSGERADKWLAVRSGGASRRAVMRAFEDGLVRVNGKRARKGQVLAAGDVVELSAMPATAEALSPVPDPAAGARLEVLHVDDRLVAVNKAPGIASHPLRAGETGTLANALVALHPECAAAGEDPREAGLVHRLDAGTSGILVAARSRADWTTLRAAFHEGRVTKQYLALVLGEVTRPGSIDLPIAHDRSRGSTAVVVCEDPDDALRLHALPARTDYTIEQRYRAFTLLRCTAHTGRMHQIRVHLAHLGTPVVGDPLYGLPTADSPPVIGHFLHAVRIELEGLALDAPLPEDRIRALNSLKSGASQG